MFAATFHNHSIIISQDDKSKVSLRIPAVGRIFKLIKTINESVSIPDHNFPLGRKIKLILSIYLLINPNDTNNSFHSGHLTIYIQLEYFVDTTALTHIANLISIMNLKDYDEVICIKEKIKLLWVLLVNGKPDKNLKHLKNIIEYSRIVLPIDHYGTHLNSQEKVINEELTKNNFRFL
ncbi:6817_t:CDS:2, partial [Gigaspora margarita]